MSSNGWKKKQAKHRLSRGDRSGDGRVFILFMGSKGRRTLEWKAGAPHHCLYFIIYVCIIE
jgi:hypothetical protein